MIISIWLPVIAGLAVFLFGMKLMELALHRLAGPYLHLWLERFTKTPLRGLATGSILSALLQSSTAITVITIGLVNAGILSFSRTLGIILGTNVGTCLTTELAGLPIGSLGLPLLAGASAIWMASWLAGPLHHTSANRKNPLSIARQSRAVNAALQESRSNLTRVAVLRRGQLNPSPSMPAAIPAPSVATGPSPWLHKIRFGSLAVAGFSLVLLGIEIMKSIGPELQTRGLFIWFVQQSQQSLLWGVIAGAAVTSLVHSSSAVIAMAMGLASIQAIPVELGIAITLGANAGTCATALIASIGGSKAGSFVAWSHVMLNVGGIVLFYPFLHQLTAISAIAAGADGPATQIARAQTIFNLASSLLALPFCYLSMWNNLERRS